MSESNPRDSGRRSKVEALFKKASPKLPQRLRDVARGVARRAKKSGSSSHTSPVRRETGIGPGSRIADRYEVLSELGRGGVATVYLAKDTKFNVEVAIKVAATSGEAILDFRARFEREARISYHVGKSPGIIRALDWGEIEKDRSLYLVLDLVPGAKPLDLQTGPLHERLERLATAAGLVDVVHKQGIVHRDVKPGNFLVSSEGTVHLGDFGTAKNLRDPEETLAKTSPAPLTRTGVLIGTPLFMAPEQFNDPRHVGRQVDVYALGVMLYRCLVGEFPYEGHTPAEFLSTQLKVRYGLAPRPRRPLQTLPDLDPALDRLCMESIELDADGRPTSAGAFLNRLLGRISNRPAGGITDLRASLRLDGDGFASFTTLRALHERLGREPFVDLLGSVPALVVTHERPVKGETQYERRVAFLLGRPERRPRDAITLGRTEESDLTVRLVSVSKQHLTFFKTERGWLAVEQGSSNGTSINQHPLAAEEQSPLTSGDRVCLAQHLTLEFLSPTGLESFLTCLD